MNRKSSFVYVRELGLFFLAEAQELRPLEGEVASATELRKLRVDGVPFPL